MNIEIKCSREFDDLGKLTIESNSLETVGAKSEHEMWVAVGLLEQLTPAFMVETRLDGKLVGALLLIPYVGCEFDIHVVWSYNYRGDFAFKQTKKMLAEMFTQRDVCRVVGKCPNEQVATFAKQVGLKEFDRQHGVIFTELTKEMFNQNEKE